MSIFYIGEGRIAMEFYSYNHSNWQYENVYDVRLCFKMVFIPSNTIFLLCSLANFLLHQLHEDNVIWFTCFNDPPSKLSFADVTQLYVFCLHPWTHIFASIPRVNTENEAGDSVPATHSFQLWWEPLADQWTNSPRTSTK